MCVYNYVFALIGDCEKGVCVCVCVCVRNLAGAWIELSNTKQHRGFRFIILSSFPQFSLQQNRLLISCW